MPKKTLPKKLEPHHPHARKTALWYQMSKEHIFDIQKSGITGLNQHDVKKRRSKYGHNQLPKAQKLSSLRMLLAQFKSPLVYILLIAACISFAFAFFYDDTDFIDAIVIGAAVCINVVIGFFQERKAQRALEELQKYVTAEATVIREGIKKKVDIHELVPGDIVEIQIGDKIPADCRLLEVNALTVDEAALTGESKTIEKKVYTISEDRIIAERDNMIFLGTVAVLGQAKAIVVATGEDTQIGKIAQMVSGEESESTPLQKKLEKFSKKLSVVVLGISIFIFVLGVLTTELTVPNVILMFETGIAVAVAAIPGGLVVAVTIVLAVGMQRILKQHALVRKLLAAETLGSTTVICTDKTGTLTDGKMRVAQIVTEEKTLDAFDQKTPQITGENAEEFVLSLRIGTLCNDAFIENPGEERKERVYRGSPTEVALLTAAEGVGLSKEDLEKETPRVDVIPFDSSSKFMATLHEFSDRENIIYLKGAPEKIMESSKYIYAHTDKKLHKKMDDKARKKIQRQYETMSRSGLRVLAVAYRKINKETKKFDDVDRVESDFVFVGLVGIKDPLRQTAKETVASAKKAGIHVVMITGDHRLTARAIGFELGLDVSPQNVLEGEDLRAMSDTQLQEKVKDITIYARVSPEDKLRIIKAWQAHGEVVAMTGDGVNDAPALKKAEIGVALGSGTEVAKGTADLILLDNNFSTIVTAVKEGRVIYDNIKKIVLYFLSDSFTEVLLIVATLLLGWPLPILVAQILYVNLVDDSFIALALTQEPAEPDIMRQSPQERDKPILDRQRKMLIGLISIVTASATLALFVWSWKTTGDIDKARTIAFTAMAFDSLLYVFSIRSLHRPIWKINHLENSYLIVSVLFGIFLQVIAIYWGFLQQFLQTVPLTGEEWIYILAACVCVIVVIEMSKCVYNHQMKSNHKMI